MRTYEKWLVVEAGKSGARCGVLLPAAASSIPGSHIVTCHVGPALHHIV